MIDYAANLPTDSFGAVSLGQCLAAGLTPRRLHWLAESGRWQLPFPRVYVMFSGPLPSETIHHAAILYAGEGAALSHESAGALWRLCPTPPKVHIVVPYRRQVDRQIGLVLHRSRTLTQEDIHPTLQPPRTAVDRTVIDLLSTKRSADAALGVIGDAVRTRLTTADRLRNAIRDKPKSRWRQVVLDALPDIDAGAHSPLEMKDVAIRRRHGLPLGTRQAKRLTDGTEYLDVLIEGYQLHVELDGRLGHDRTRERWRDMRRDNRSELAGMRHLRFGWADVVDRPCEVAAQQAQILQQQGWPGPFKRCSKCQ